MAWKLFPLLVTSLLALNAVLVVYSMNRRESQHKTSNISEISSRRDVGHHRMELTSVLRQGLENRKFIVCRDQMGFVLVWDWYTT